MYVWSSHIAIEGSQVVQHNIIDQNTVLSPSFPTINRVLNKPIDRQEPRLCAYYCTAVSVICDFFQVLSFDTINTVHTE